MANQSAGVGSRPVADNAKAVASNVAYFAPGIAGAAQTITPAGGAESASVVNKGNDFIRVLVNFTAGITATPATAAQRVFVVAPGDAHTVDFADHAGDNAAGAIVPIASITIAPVQMPTGAANSVTESSALALTAAAATLGGSVIVNFASS